MLTITYNYFAVIFILCFFTVRIFRLVYQKKFLLSYELKQAFICICVLVIVRFTFFEFTKVDGQIVPLVFDYKKIYPFRINLLPFVYLFDYPPEEFRSMLINVIGNVAMFIPVGIIIPMTYIKCRTITKTVFTGFLCSLSIEIIQLLFETRVTDIDDLILNTIGVLIGSLFYFGIKRIKK